MYHYVNAITNTKGDALIGFFVKAVDAVTGSTASLYADANSTPIVSVSGIANAAEVDSDGNASFYIAGGEYHIDIYATDGVTFLRRISNVPMVDFTVAAGNVASRAILSAKNASAGDVWTLTEEGRTGLFKFDASDLSDEVTADTQQGIYIAPDSDDTGASGAWVRQYSGPQDALWFATGDGTTDDNGAFQSLATEDQGHAFVVPASKYRISATSKYRGLVSISGYGNGQNPGTVDGVSYPYPTFFSGSVIYSDANITALEFQPFTSETDVATVIAAEAAHRTQQSAAGSKIADLSIISAGNGAAHAGKYGLYTRTRIFASNLYIYGHGDDGFKIDASTVVDGHAYGNANGSLVLGLESSGNAGNGFSNGGSDANGSLFMGFILSENDGWGIDDDSQIGCTYLAPLVSANGNGSIRTADNSPVLILGGYIEPDSGKLADLGDLTMLIGGNAADEANHAALSPAFVFNAGVAHCKGIAGKNRTGPMHAQAGLGRDPSATAGTAFWFGSSDDTASMDAFRLTKDFQWGGVWSFTYAGSVQIEEYVTSDHPASGLTNGYAKGFPNGIYMGTVQSAPRLCPAAAAMPATGSYRAGDLVPNNTPAVGGILLWRRLTTGSAHVAGTDWEIVYGGLSNSAGIGYATGAGGTVTQITSRTTGVTLNKVCGAITLVSAAGTATWQSFTVTNSTVAATDVIRVNQKSGTDLNMIHVTNVAAGSFQISFATTGGTTTEQPVFNFSVIKAVAA